MRSWIIGALIVVLLLLPVYGLFLWLEGGGRNFREDSYGSEGGALRPTCGRTEFVAKSRETTVAVRIMVRSAAGRRTLWQTPTDPIPMDNLP